MVKAVAVIVLGLATIAAGCGSSQNQAAPSTPRETPKNCTIHTARQRAELKQLHADVASMRRAAAPVKKQTLMGTAATRAATDRFIRHVDASRLPVFVKSRMIDHAAAAVSSACEQCFQQLEAGRPVAGGAKLAQSC
jgi:hypothetical protein